MCYIVNRLSYVAQTCYKIRILPTILVLLLYKNFPLTISLRIIIMFRIKYRVGISRLVYSLCIFTVFCESKGYRKL